MFFCQSNQYKAINNAKQQALYENQKDPDNPNSIASLSANPASGNYTQEYNEQVLGLKYSDDGLTIKDPYKSDKTPTVDTTIKCIDGSNPDQYGCCAGEEYTDMGEDGFNCCPVTGGDCFPPIL